MINPGFPVSSSIINFRDCSKDTGISFPLRAWERVSPTNFSLQNRQPAWFPYVRLLLSRYDLSIVLLMKFCALIRGVSIHHRILARAVRAADIKAQSVPDLMGESVAH